MKVLFHGNQLCIRGTTTALEDYAIHNQDILGNESIISYNLTAPNTDPEVVSRIEKKFKVMPYDNVNAFQKIIDKEKIDFSYFIRFGTKEFLPDNCKTGVHTVFSQYEPHGDVYAYVSEWLANTMSKRTGVNNLPWVPHMVNLPAPTENYRTMLGIPNDKIIIGRMGGSDTFDLNFVYYAINQILTNRNDIVFVFVNTNRWINHPNVLFLPGIYDPQIKSNMINTWDAMIHARSQGESFGIAIADALSLNKPVLAWEGGFDQHHATLLANSGLLYNQQNIIEKLNNIADFINAEDWTRRVERFKPDQVINTFNKVFLKTN